MERGTPRDKEPRDGGGRDEGESAPTTRSHGDSSPPRTHWPGRNENPASGSTRRPRSRVEAVRGSKRVTTARTGSSVCGDARARPRSERQARVRRDSASPHEHGLSTIRMRGIRERVAGTHGAGLVACEFEVRLPRRRRGRHGARRRAEEGSDASSRGQTRKEESGTLDCRASGGARHEAGPAGRASGMGSKPESLSAPSSGSSVAPVRCSTRRTVPRLPPQSDE